jgi:hypothetical protein
MGITIAFLLHDTLNFTPNSVFLQVGVVRVFSFEILDRFQAPHTHQQQQHET